MLPAGIPCPAPQNRNKVFSGSAKIVRRGYSPPGTGGVAAPLRKRREASEAAQTGWSDRRAYVFAELTTPAAPSKEASRHFLDGASTPPVPGGEHPRLNQSVFLLESKHGDVTEDRPYCRSRAPRWASERGQDRSHRQEGGVRQTARCRGIERHRGGFVRAPQVDPSAGGRAGFDQTARTESERPLFGPRSEYEGPRSGN